MVKVTTLNSGRFYSEILLLGLREKDEQPKNFFLNQLHSFRDFTTFLLEFRFL